MFDNSDKDEIKLLQEQREQAFLKKVSEEYQVKEQLSSQYSILEKSRKHLEDSNMTYWYHFKHSISNGNRLFKLVLSSYIHAVIPWKLKQHAARGIIKLYEDMKQWPHLRKAMLEESLKRKEKI